MTRFRAALTLAGTCLLLAGLGTAEARDIKVKRPAPAPVKAEAAPVAAAKPAGASVVVAVPACARKVKVIYAGYGEADRATCTQSAMDTTIPTSVATR